MVQLKAEGEWRGWGCEEFQFLVVQLKVVLVCSEDSTYVISIPCGSIKRIPARIFAGTRNVFQFLVVQLKEIIAAWLMNPDGDFNSLWFN